MTTRRLLSLFSLSTLFVVSAGAAAAADTPSRESIANYGKLPLAFEANTGQTDSRVRFLARGSGYTVFLTGNEAVVKLSHTLRMTLIDANDNAGVLGSDVLPGKSNYLIGNDTTKWHTKVPTYAKVTYSGVYPGVDLIYYGNQAGQLEYDFVVAPGARVSDIKLLIAPDSMPAKGVNALRRLRIDSNGDLLVRMDGAEMRFHKPVAYQDGDHRALRTGRFVLTASNQVSFSVGRYDHRKALIIDPILSYSTYLSGSSAGGTSIGKAIAIDASGNAYITGLTTDANFPTGDPYQPTFGPGGDAFVTKLAPSGSALVYSTYLSGDNGSVGNGIAVDSSGAVYVTGQAGTGFPTVNPIQTTACGSLCAFITKIDPSGATLVYSTYFGGTASANPSAIAVDSSSDAYVTGFSGSGFLTVNAIQSVDPGGSDNAFVVKINAAGSAFVYATYLGGSAGSEAYSIAADSSGSAYVAGTTKSTDFPTQAPFQSVNKTISGGAGEGTAFLSKINPSGSALVYSTYFGGSIFEQANGVAVDASGNAYIAGITSSADFPTRNPLQASSVAIASGGVTGFVTEFNAAGSALVYSTYLGGSVADNIRGIALDAAGNTYVNGTTSSADFPSVNPLPASQGGTTGTSFISEIGVGGGSLVFSTQFGNIVFGASTPDGQTDALAMAVDAGGDAYVTGGVNSATFPTLNAFQATYQGSESDAFVAKIAHAAANTPTVTISVSPTAVTAGQSTTVTWSSTNATSCIASGAWTGTQILSGSVAETPTATGSSAYTLTCTGSSGSANATATVTVNAAPRPTVSISVNPTSITPGQSATLYWSSTSATSCTASGAWTGNQTLSGSVAETPNATGANAYTLSCAGSGGSASATATLTVNAAAQPTVTISISPTSITQGQSATLTWSSSNATSCTASGAWSGAQATSGSLQVTPSGAGSATYSLACSGSSSGSSAMSSTILQVMAPQVTVTALSGKAGGGGLGIGMIAGLLTLALLRIRRILKLRALAAAALLVIASQAIAQDASAPLQFNWDGSYLGIRAGLGDYTETSQRLDNALASAGETGTTTSITQHRASGVLYAGVPFYRTLSLELGFADLGTYPVEISTNGAKIPQLAQTITRMLPAAGRGITLNLAAALNLSPWFAIEPRFGLLAYQSKQEVFTPAGTVSDNRKSAGFDAGIAFLVTPTHHVSIGAGADCFDAGGRCNVLLYSAVIEYHFGQ